MRLSCSHRCAFEGHRRLHRPVSLEIALSESALPGTADRDGCQSRLPACLRDHGRVLACELVEASIVFGQCHGFAWREVGQRHQAIERPRVDA